MAHFGQLLSKSCRATGQAALPIPTPLTLTAPLSVTGGHILIPIGKSFGILYYWVYMNKFSKYDDWCRLQIFDIWFLTYPNALAIITELHNP